MEEVVSGLFAIANLRSTLKQAQEGVERAGDIHAVLNLERFSNISEGKPKKRYI